MFLLIIQTSPILGLLLRETVPFAESSIWPKGVMSGRECNLQFFTLFALVVNQFWKRKIMHTVRYVYVTGC